MGSLFWHVDRIEDGIVFGHATSCCDPAGCCSDGWVLEGVDPRAVDVGKTYEIADDSTVVCEASEEE